MWQWCACGNRWYTQVWHTLAVGWTCRKQKFCWAIAKSAKHGTWQSKQADYMSWKILGMLSSDFRDSFLDNRACQQSFNTSMQCFTRHRLRQAYNTILYIVCLTKPVMNETLHWSIEWLLACSIVQRRISTSWLYNMNCYLLMASQHVQTRQSLLLYCSTGTTPPF